CGQAVKQATFLSTANAPRSCLVADKVLWLEVGLLRGYALLHSEDATGALTACRGVATALARGLSDRESDDQPDHESDHESDGQLCGESDDDESSDHVGDHVGQSDDGLRVVTSLVSPLRRRLSLLLLRLRAATTLRSLLSARYEEAARQAYPVLRRVLRTDAFVLRDARPADVQTQERDSLSHVMVVLEDAALPSADDTEDSKVYRESDKEVLAKHAVADTDLLRVLEDVSKHKAVQLLRHSSARSLCVTCAKALVQLRRDTLARLVIYRTRALCTTENVTQQPPHRQQLAELAFVGVGVECAAGRHSAAYDLLRDAIDAAPHSSAVLTEFLQVLHAMRFHSKLTRHVRRALDKAPESLPLRLLLAHTHGVKKTFHLALLDYLDVRQRLRRRRAALARHVARMQSLKQQTETTAPGSGDDGDEATIDLLVAVCFLQQAMKRSVAGRHAHLRQALAFLMRYCQAHVYLPSFERRTQSHGGARAPPAMAFCANVDAEASFNAARFFHFLGLRHLAVPLYERVLSLAPQSLPPDVRLRSAAGTDGADSDHTDGEDQLQTVPRSFLVAGTERAHSPLLLPHCVDLSREAAHNLAIIYAESGSPELSRRLMSQYLVI
ncbi:MAG: hypothetical protein MHM6MM_003878, partial [Cercozoa sp. M6MM]